MLYIFQSIIWFYTFYLTGKGIIEEWRELIGPKSVEDAKANAPNSLRSQYGTREMLNALHGSDSHESAIRYR